MSNTHNNEAVKALLSETDKEVCIETLDDMFECWLTHERNDCTNTNLRAERYYAYKGLREMLNSFDYSYKTTCTKFKV